MSFAERSFLHFAMISESLVSMEKKKNLTNIENGNLKKKFQISFFRKKFAFFMVFKENEVSDFLEGGIIHCLLLRMELLIFHFLSLFLNTQTF